LKNSLSGEKWPNVGKHKLQHVMDCDFYMDSLRMGEKSKLVLRRQQPVFHTFAKEQQEFV
jgi:hypothetical protein